MKPIIQFNNVSLKFDNTIFIKGFTKQIFENEKVVFSGVSGSGKSSLLNSILGFVPIHEGEIWVNDLQVNAKNIHEIRKIISWLPQDLFFDIKSCRELVNLPFSFVINKKFQPKENQFQEMISQLLLPNDILDKNLNEISGGQRQRLILASLLLLPKPILILDEPTSALDQKSTEALLEIIQTQKKTLISSSHDAFWNNKMDKIILL
jgi:putative ABC transport system ATP-binding protein